MEITKIVKWMLSSGKAIEAQITVTREMTEDIAYSDGWNVDLGKKPFENEKINVYIDGKFYGSDDKPSVVKAPYWGEDTIKKVKAANGYALIASNVVVSKENYDMIIAAMEDAINEASKDEEYTAYIDGKKATEEAVRPAKEAAEKELKETEIPVEAVKAYNQYHGDAEKAWENENETAWALIRKWSPYIEAQHGMDPEKTKAIISEMNAESSYGISEEA